jgi:hypothetical protein
MRWSHLPVFLCVVGLAWSQDQVRTATVCELLVSQKTFDGQPVAVVGRYSLRETGRLLGEDDCSYAGPASSTAAKPAVVTLRLDRSGAPHLAAAFAVEAPKLDEKVRLVHAHSRLENFPFGTPDYDRWAVVYGKFEMQANQPARAVLRYAGDSYVIFLK